MLTEAEIRAAKPQSQPYKLFDERGLYLLVHPNGSRYWRFKYRVTGREKLLALGVYPDVTLKKARERRDTVRIQLADGIDPAQKRKMEKEALADTFERVAEEFLAQQAKSLAVVTDSDKVRRIYNRADHLDDLRSSA